MPARVRFASVGISCVGLLYRPSSTPPGHGFPAIIMAHGFAGEKEMALPAFAEEFSRHGFATLTFDYRYWGESEGEPRQQLFPLEEVEDVRNAITWLSSQPEIDSSRIGLWGTSLGGAIAVHAATFDRRVKVVVAQVPSLRSPEGRKKVDPTRWEAMGDLLLRDRVERYASGRVNYLKITSDRDEPCALPGDEAHAAYGGLTAASTKTRTTWFNGVTVESMEKLREFDPVATLPMLAPTPLLMVAAEKDRLIPLQQVREAFERAGETKTLVEFPVKHFDLYSEPWSSRAIRTELDWFGRYLGSVPDRVPGT